MLQTPLAAFRMIMAIVFVGAATLVCAAYLIVLGRINPDSRQIPAIMRGWARWFLIFAGVRLVVEGAEKIDQSGSYVFVGNHSSNLDIPVIMYGLPVSSRFLTKKELFKVPVLGGGMRAINMIETDRRAGPLAHRIINEQVSRVIARGLSLMIFPEGTRTKDGNLLTFKKGAFRIAIDNEMPVVPVTIVGAFESWTPHTWRMYGGEVRLVIHEMIPTADLEHGDIDAIRDLARAAVESGRSVSRD
jgi:1-acyl-sn-glycerol-3-phosphate acyltransferase